MQSLIFNRLDRTLSRIEIGQLRLVLPDGSHRVYGGEGVTARRNLAHP